MRPYLQSKCFFFGPITSSVVALQTDLANPCPAKLYLAAVSLSLMDWPAMLPELCDEGVIANHYDGFKRPYNKEHYNHSEGRRREPSPHGRQYTTGRNGDVMPFTGSR